MSVGPTAIIGGGAWGTALATHLGRRGRTVRLWMRESELVRRMRERRDNPVHLPGVRVPDTVTPFHEMDEAVEGAGLVLFVVPSKFARGVYRRLAGHAPRAVPVVVTSKGIEEETLALPLEVARQELGEDARLAVLSGPSFAVEVAEGHPTAVVVAAGALDLAVEIQSSLSSRVLRLYTNDDPTGVQLAGALKNIIAIAVGVADSLGMGHNARAALITRGLAEMARLGTKLGGRPATFSGLAGLGDLVLTCTGDLSRNRRVGRRLGHGERLQDILAASRSVAEGVSTTRSARALAQQHGVDMPIVEEVHRMLFEEGPAEEALERLMRRPLTSELEPRGDRGGPR